jgi:hypothetical protein
MGAAGPLYSFTAADPHVTAAVLGSRHGSAHGFKAFVPCAGACLTATLKVQAGNLSLTQEETVYAGISEAIAADRMKEMRERAARQTLARRALRERRAQRRQQAQRRRGIQPAAPRAATACDL